MNDRPTRKQLFAIADSKGFLFRKGKKTPTLQIYPDGTILRCDVRPDLAIPMGPQQAFDILGK